MTEVRCQECGQTSVARSRFDAVGECPECGADAGELVELDAYDEEVDELRCGECGWEVEAGVRVEWGGKRRIFTVDDECPVCSSIEDPGVLVPIGAAGTVREIPEHGVARAAARELREQHAGSGVPVDVERIARELGLRVRRGPFANGMLEGTEIGVPEGHSGAERFVIAHEIGHHVLRHSAGREKIEPEANAFASELLLPTARLRSAVGQGVSIRELATRFGVSRQAVVYAVRAAKLLHRLNG